MLVYKPPPLDEVWLSEGERRERRKELEQQHQRYKRIEHELETQNAAERLRETREYLHPRPATITDDDSLPGLAADSGGESSDDESINMWKDHPVQEVG